LLVCFFVGGTVAKAATQPIYINSAEVHITAPPQVAPQIDSTAFVNQSQFEINDIYFTGLPYQTFNTRYFTNIQGAAMLGDLGFRFDFVNGNARAPMTQWQNKGSISGNTFLLVNASNIVSTATLGTSDQGLIRITGGNINLRGSSIRSGFASGFFSSGFNLSDTNYIDPNGVTDNYWGTGTNNLTFPGNFDPTNGLSSPVHGVIDSSGRSNAVSIPSFLGQLLPGNVGAYAYTTRASATSTVVQVIFAPTNSLFDTNMTTRAYWIPDADNGATAVVELGYREFDIINRSFNTNFFYITDTLAFTTNVVLAKNDLANTRRPNTYELVRANYPFYVNPLTSNIPYSPSLIYNTSSQSNKAAAKYAAFSATVSPITILNGSGQNVYQTTDPTNYPGRIEINGDSLTLDQTRIRAEATVIIKTRDLASNKVAQIDAPFANFDLRTTQPQLVVTNFAPKSVQRLAGQVYGWSATWSNTEIGGGQTNTVLYHVMMIDHNLTAGQGVVINELALHAPHIVLGDPLAVRKSMLLDSRGLEVAGGLTLPSGVDWNNANVVEVYNLTNNGFISAPRSELIGTDRPNPYDTYVNRGTNVAASHQIRTHYLENSGCLQAVSGIMNVNADTLKLGGPPITTNSSLVAIITNGFLQLVEQTNVTGAKLQANSGLQVNAGSMTFSNAILQTGAGALVLAVTNDMRDAGIGAQSEWILSGGFTLMNHPVSGDLMGTHVLTQIRGGAEIPHSWAAEDRGAVPNGFSNNCAVGRLTLDGDQFSVFDFSSGDGTQRAMYVEYLELLNYATNANSQIAIDPNFTIYFANANVQASKLDGAAGGRIKWVKSFTGPRSSSTYTYFSTNVTGQVIATDYVFNAALVGDKDLDSDGDGIVNNQDPTPIYTPSSVGLKIVNPRRKGVPPQVSISWNALPGVTNRIEYRPDFTNSVWNVLTNIVPAAPASRLTVSDLLPNASSNTVERIYRISITPSP